MSQTKVKSGLLNFPDQTDFVKLPSGTTAQRPVSPEKGYSRYNTTDNKLEFWNGTLWQQLPGVVAPIITSISYPGDDLAADPAGGQTITINGSDFQSGATVTVGGTTPSVITFVSATQITFEAPTKAAGDYDIVVTNPDGGNATAVNGMAYNGVPSWTTPAGNLGTFPAGSTIPTITLVATEPDSGVISYSVTTGALPTGLTLTGADIDGNVPTPAGETTYNFSVTASDDENQSTERAFNIVVYLQVTNTVSTVDPFGDSSGVALYQLNGDATDESGNYNGVVTGTLSYNTGVFGQAADFLSNDAAITANTFVSSLTDTQDFSISMWFKNDGFTSPEFKSLIGANSSASQGVIRVLLRYVSANTYTIEFARGYNSNYYSYDKTPNITLLSSSWYNLSITFNSSLKKIEYYLNGSLISYGNITVTTTGISISNQIVFGQYINNGAYPTYSWGGLIDQVRFFNTALTPLEVSSLYEERTVLCGGQAETVDILGDNSCIALYPLDGNANDLSGNYSGTPIDVSYGVGEFDLAGVFNGSSSWVSGSPNIGFGQSISMWFDVNSGIPVSNQGLWSQSVDGGLVWAGTNVYWDGSNFSLSMYVRNNSSYRYQTSGTITLNTGWNHIVFTFDNNSGYSAWLNNSELTMTTTISSGTVSSLPTGTTTIGRMWGNNDNLYFNGKIDQVRIFNKALSAGEVTTLYNETACDVLACSGTTNTLDILGDGSCIAAYPLDGSPLDLSGNYNGVQTDVTYPQGEFDLAGSFNGSSSVIDVDSFISTSVFAISFWLKAPIPVNWNSLIQSPNTDVNSNLINTLFGHIGYFPDGGYGAGYVYVDSSIINVQDNNWHHIVLTCGGTYATTQIYIDGISRTLTGNGTLMQLRGTLNIGQRTDGDAGSNLNGQIDQVRIFNKALSAGEVTTLYNETACN